MHYADHPKLSRRMRVGTHRVAEIFRPLIGAPDLRKTEKESLLRSEPVKLLLIDRAVFESAEQGHVGKPNAGVIRSILAKR